jgi:hypothetical protein
MTSVFVVMDNQIESNEVIRVYLDEAEANVFVKAHRDAGTAYYDIDEHHLGAPDVPYDGPVWVAKWSTRRKQVGEVQLILKRADGFTMVMPSVVPSSGYGYQEFFYSPPRPPAVYEEPPVWIDTFLDPWQEWWTGDPIPDAEVVERDDTSVTVRGSSKTAVEQLVRDTARSVKAALPGEQQ